MQYILTEKEYNDLLNKEGEASRSHKELSEENARLHKIIEFFQKPYRNHVTVGFNTDNPMSKSKIIYLTYEFDKMDPKLQKYFSKILK